MRRRNNSQQLEWGRGKNWPAEPTFPLFKLAAKTSPQTKLDLWNLLHKEGPFVSWQPAVARRAVAANFCWNRKCTLFSVKAVRQWQPGSSASSWWNMAIIVHWLHNYSRALIYGHSPTKPGLSFRLKIRPKKELSKMTWEDPLCWFDFMGNPPNYESKGTFKCT